TMDGELKEGAVPLITSAPSLNAQMFQGVSGIAISADGERMVLRKQAPKEFAYVEVSTGREINHWPDDAPVSDTVNSLLPPRIRLSPDSKYLAVHSAALSDYRRLPEPYLGVGETASGKKLYELGRKELDGSLSNVQLQPFSPDGTRLVLCTVRADDTTSAPRTVRVLDTRTGHQLQAFSLPL